MLHLWEWNPANSSWRPCAKASDGFEPLCQDYGTNVLAGCLETTLTRVDQERLLTICAGTLEFLPDWYYIPKMRCFIAEADERSKRLTFTQELSLESRNWRNDHITRYIRLRNEILKKDHQHFPPIIEDLKGNWKIIAPRKAHDFRFNTLNKTTDKGGATLIFLGAVAPKTAREFVDRLRLTWGTKENIFREETTRRIVVWYQNAASGAIQCEHSPVPEITNDSEPPGSITQTEAE